MKNKLMIIDGNSLFFRAYYGSAHGPAGILTNSSGQAINGVLTFHNMLEKLFRNYEPTHLFIAFDAGKKTFRHEKLESYKGGRSKTPVELISQFPLLKEMLDLWGIKRFQKDYIEADDIIGSLAITSNKEYDVLVVSSDKDLYQLVDEGITVVAPRNGALPDKIMQIETFKMETGYTPSQVPDIKGLAGDSSDNLVGVAGIGEKGAVKLITAYDKLENIFNHLDDLTPNLSLKLSTGKEGALLCKEIATLKLDVEIPFKQEEMLFLNEKSDELISFYEKHEMNSLLRRYGQKKVQKKEKESSQITFGNLIL